MDIFVNRGAQLELLESMIFGASAGFRIALISGCNEMGKTALINQLYERCKTRTPVALIDVAGINELGEFLTDLAGQFSDQGINLSAYQSMASTQTAPQQLIAELSHIQAVGSPIDLVITAVADARREANMLLGLLLDAVDLSVAIPRRVILIDHFDTATLPLNNWVRKSLIPGILYREAVVCAIASSSTIPLTRPQEQKAAPVALACLDVEHISAWLSEAGIICTEDNAQFLHRGTRGIPGKVNSFIATMLADRGSPK